MGTAVRWMWPCCSLEGPPTWLVSSKEHLQHTVHQGWRCMQPAAHLATKGWRSEPDSHQRSLIQASVMVNEAPGTRKMCAEGCGLC